MTANKLLDKIFGNFFYVKVFYLCILILQFQVFTRDLVGPFVKLALVYGFLVIVYDLFTKRNIFKNKFFPLIVLFFIFLFLSIIVNADKKPIDDFKIFTYAALEFFVIAMLPSDKSEEEVKKEYRILSLIVIVSLALIAIASIITFALYIRQPFKNDTGLYYVGVAPDFRLHGISGNPNTLAMQMMFLFAVASIYLTVFKPKQKVWIAIVLFLALVCLMLSGSRSAKLSFFAFLVVFIFLLSMSRSKQKISFKLCIKNAVITAVVVSVIFACGKLVTFGAGYIPSLTENIRNSLFGESVDTEDLFERVQTERNDTDTAVDGSGRITLFKTAFQIFKHHPLFGVGMSSMREYGLKYMDGIELSGFNLGSVHNLPLQILACSGIFAFIVFMSLLIFFAVKSLTKIVKDFSNGRINLLFISVFSVIVMIILHEMFEMQMIYRPTFESFMFAWNFGYLQYFLSNKKSAADSA